jgi:hypothetical protein
MYVFFPSFILKVDTAVDCHLSYKPLGRSATLSSLDYVQPTSHSSASTTTAIPSATACIEPDDDESKAPTFANHWPKKPPMDSPPKFDLSLILPPAFSVNLQDMDRDELIHCLYHAESTKSQPDYADATNSDVLKSRTCTPLQCMTQDEIIAQLHHPETSLPPIRPSNRPNGSNTKSTWTPEELHCITGCRPFRNYRHIIDASTDGHLIDTGEFPISLGSYTTIPKAPCSKYKLPWSESLYQNIE